MSRRDIDQSNSIGRADPGFILTVFVAVFIEMAEFPFQIKDFTQEKVYKFAKEHGFRGEGIRKSKKNGTKWCKKDVQSCPYVKKEERKKKEVGTSDASFTTPIKKADLAENMHLAPTRKLELAAELAKDIITHEKTDTFTEHHVMEWLLCFMQRAG